MANAHHDAVELKTNLVAQPGTFRSGKARLDKRWVHKSYDENVLISHIEAVQPQTSAKKGNEAAETHRTDHFRAVLCVTRDHPLFFDRDCGHVHAICLMEAAQQTTIAIAHLFYGVPLDVESVQTECSAQFRSMATVDAPLIVEQSISGHVYRRGRLMRMQATVLIRQGNLERVRIAGTVLLLKKELLKYLEELSAAGDFNPALMQPTGSCS